MIKRVMTAVIGIPLLVFIVYLGGFFLTSVISLLLILGLLEFHNISVNFDRKNPIFLLLAGGIIFPFTVFLEPKLLPIFIFVYLMVCFVYYLVNFPKFNPLDLALTIFGVVYLAGGLSHLVILRNLESGFWLVIYVFIIVWSTDTGAYFSGIYFGNKKLAPMISPKKTWVGFIGGLLTSFVVILVFVFQIDIKAGTSLILIAPLVSLGSQIGDLFESSLKRFAGVKDSGNIIPGHGGILDRFDSMLWAAPLTYYLIILFGKGVN